MKKILFATAILGISLTSCDDFLEEENLSTETAENFYTTAEGFESLVTANYSQLREIYGDEPWLFCAGTDMYAEGRDQEPVGLSQYLQLNSASEGVGQLYSTCYRAIQIANMALYYSELTESFDQLNQYVGEVEYMRANAYFLLVQTYGGVGIVTDYIDSPVLSFDRNTAQEVYDLVIADLQSAMNKVSSGAFSGRVTKRAVDHLLAKVYLARAYESFGSSSDFQMAAQYADEAIAGQGLNLSFQDLWSPGNELNEEVLFSVQYDAGSVSADPFNLGNQQSFYFSSYLGGSEVAGDAPYRSFNLCPTDYTLELYEQGDERWEATFMTEVFTRYYDYFDVDDHSSLTVVDFYEPKWFTELDKTAYIAAHPDVTYHEYGTYGADDSTENYGTIPVKKFDDPSSPFGSGGVSTRDVVLSRLGDTYLIAAEAYFQSGDVATALNRLNVVRERANATPATTGDMSIGYILDERARELLGEYHRWFDLKRTGTLIDRASMYHYLIQASNFDGANGEKKILRPIPQSAIDLNQNQDFPQNPAYN
ncbi:RagB/SusD family nutrient uptake outer membrane protein [Robertkochia solimangrovi]|uniref:RagB/SusD family nutrient uptake outer membrane protein n=1 Tax=Robertkochia solimangrovi TaxID=2213046 RepID=UPI00117C792F|nr:RagB/SusD family nutrient uptake outer membrane protein [Robertkochia solimangrovi]TRZ46479.1 RagB/SusD family nutrient uptake outer membrane protein [Robertkochia solimangrovi]